MNYRYIGYIPYLGYAKGPAGAVGLKKRIYVSHKTRYMSLFITQFLALSCFVNVCIGD